MQLDSLIIETRLRSGWSAIDLGFSLARRFWLRSICVYLVVALIVYGSTYFFTANYQFLPYFVLWWFKPLFERPILYMLSRELFAEPMPFSKILKEYRRWLKPGFFWIVTIRRLSIYRGMHAPISLLETPARRDYGPRASVLGAKHSSEALWLNVVLLHVEMIMAFAIFALVAILAPELVNFSNLISEADKINSFWIDLINMLVMACVAPFYVAGGFMLYISRRVEIEGWDIEIIFRDWMSRYSENKMDTFLDPSMEPAE